MGRRERSGEPGRLTKIAAPRGGFGAGGKSAATARATHGWGRTGGDHVLSLRHGERLSVPTIGRALDSAVRCGVPARSEGRLCAERPESRDPETGYLCKLDWRNLLEMIRAMLAASRFVAIPHTAPRATAPARLGRTSIAFGASVPEFERRDGYAHVLHVQELRQTQDPRPRPDHPRRDRDVRPVRGAQLDDGLAHGPQD